MADVNDVVKEEWKEDTTAFQRVKSIIGGTYDGETARDIADRALVAESTARSHLEDLADDGFVEKTSDPTSGATLYLRSWQSLVLEQARDIADQTDSETLLQKVNEMRERIRGFQETTGVDSPEDIAWNDTELDEEMIRTWKTTERNLSFAKVALALDQAEDIVDRQADA
ncbi:DUF7342 family protein [Natronorubrum texcoconense]|uniref:Uncharacterized protein n=1 Tax=Natronorubrum texcoconense TaxID=1095776 RepID=A0A1G8X1G8_9EURY|nr:transcriptional regulator [Natronorubrum texcoconense]SDJ84177.1 hypothetical protein SAMN04515672_1577 [Natronorubrum texcoconense]